jgi:hypothetical protein
MKNNGLPQYEKRIGTRTVLNTDFPVVACAAGSGREWTSFILCNRTIEDRAAHSTLKDAKLRVDFLARRSAEASILDATIEAAEIWQ